MEIACGVVDKLNFILQLILVPKAAEADLNSVYRGYLIFELTDQAEYVIVNIMCVVGVQENLRPGWQSIERF